MTTTQKMRLSILSFVLLVFIAISGSLALNAQSTTQGSIAGTVVDSSGAVIPGASVTILNKGTGFTAKLTGDASGYYKAPLLEPGTYTVSVTAANFANYTANNVEVVVGQVTSIEPHLAVASSSSEVVVTEQAPVMNLESPDFSATLSTAALSNIPINNRRWSALAMTTPGVVSDGNGYGLVSVRGISTLLNNVEIDGADDNDAFYAEERGRTREAYSTSASAVREFAVNTGVYSAEYGRAAGGVITSVTKSGTNQLHGQAYFYDRESKFNAYNDYAKVSVLNSGSGQYVSTSIKPEDIRKIYGFTVGGSLIKDKLFWIYTYDQHSRIFPGQAVPASASAFYTLPNPTTTGTCSLTTGYLTGDSNTIDQQACTLAARQHAGSYAAGAALYDSGIAGLVSDLGTVSRAGYQEINTPKLDWQINSKEHFSVLYHRLNWDSPGGVQTTATDDYGRDTWGNDFAHLNYGVAKLTSLISNNVSNEILYQYSRELLDETQQPYTSYTQANLEGTGGSVGNVPEVAVDTAEGMFIGSPYYSYRKALPDERKWQIDDIAYWSKGNHTLKFGVDLLHNYDLMNNTYESNGDYVYNYLGNYFNDLLNIKNGTPNSCNSSGVSAATSTTSAVGTYTCYADFYQGFGAPVYADATMDTGAFVQDNWKFSPRLSLELGLRWDYEAIPGPDPNLTKATTGFVPFVGLLNNPSDKLNFGPRIGFSYDVYGGGTTVLRGGYGLYYGRINNGELLNIRLSTGSPLGQYTTTYKSTTAGAPSMPNIETGTGAASATPSSNFLASNLKSPEVQEFDLALQQSVGHGTIFELSYLGGLGRRLPNLLDVNLNPTTTNVTVTVSDATNSGPLGPNGTTYVVPTYTAYGNTGNPQLFSAGGTSVANNFQVVTEMVSNINSNYNALVAEIVNRSLKNVQFDANYTWSHALDYGQSTATTSTATNNWYNPYGQARINYGDSSFNVPNRFVAYALYKFPNLTTSNFVKYITNDWSLDDSFQMQNGLPYTVGVSGFTSPAILSDWNGGSGSTMIPFIGPDTLKYPRREVDDARLQKQITFQEGRSLQIMFNVFNLANHQNVDGLGTTAYKLSGTTATYQGQVGNSALDTYQVSTSSNNSGFLYTPRELELAARFEF